LTIGLRARGKNREKRIRIERVERKKPPTKPLATLEKTGAVRKVGGKEPGKGEVRK